MRYLSKAKPKELKGRALVRLDFNTEDEWRMEAAVPTLKFLAKHAAKIVVVSHRGRPKGFDAKLSLQKDAAQLGRFLGKKVSFLPHFQFGGIRTEIDRAPEGSVFLLENLRFVKGEEANDARFARELASLADYYVNDAFAVSHRDDASVVAVTEHLPSYAGLLMEKEVKSMGGVLAKPRRPLVVIVGGAKAHDKLGVIRFLKKKTDTFLFGGAAANTLLYLRGENVGKSLIDREEKDYPGLREVLAMKNAVLPVDWISEGGMIYDIGPKTVQLFRDKIRAAGTIVWSGPLGFIEKKKFAHGTLQVAKAVAANRRAFSMTGGGETVMFLKKHKLDKKFSFISTGGGAMVDFLAGEKLPGLEALKRSAQSKKS